MANQAGFQHSILPNSTHGAVAILHGTAIAYMDRDKMLHLDTGGYPTRATAKAMNTFLQSHGVTNRFIATMRQGSIYINYKADDKQWQEELNPRLTLDLNFPIDTSTSVYINPNTSQR